MTTPVLIGTCQKDSCIAPTASISISPGSGAGYSTWDSSLGATFTITDGSSGTFSAGSIRYVMAVVGGRGTTYPELWTLSDGASTINADPSIVAWGGNSSPTHGSATDAPHIYDSSGDGTVDAFGSVAQGTTYYLAAPTAMSGITVTVIQLCSNVCGSDSDTATFTLS
jgi:hypothetical protein